MTKKVVALDKLPHIGEQLVDFIELDSSKRYLIVIKNKNGFPAEVIQEFVKQSKAELDSMFSDGKKRFFITWLDGDTELDAYEIGTECSHDWRDKKTYSWCNNCGERRNDL